MNILDFLIKLLIVGFLAFISGFLNAFLLDKHINLTWFIYSLNGYFLYYLLHHITFIIEGVK